MNNELIFRIIFWILFFILFIFNRIIPAIKAKRGDEKLLPDNYAKKNEGKIIFIFRIILFIPFMLFLILYAVYPEFMHDFHFDLPIWFRWFGSVLAFISLLFWIWSQSILDKYWSPQLQIQKEHTIISSGPYGVIRHPIYSAMLGWVIGLVLLTAHFGFALLAVITIIFLVLRAPKEEKMMLKQFGDEYKTYIQKTGRFFPKIR